MDFTKVVNKRHSVRQFTDQAVETDLIKEIVTVAQRTPSWGQLAALASLLRAGNCPATD